MDKRSRTCLLVSLLVFSLCMPGCGNPYSDFPTYQLDSVFTLKGPSDDYAHGVAVDDSGNIYITGGFMDILDMDPGPAALNLQNSSDINTDAFLAKYDPDGNHIWSLSWGSADTGSGNQVEIGPDGTIYVYGSYTGTIDFDPGPGTFIMSSAGRPEQAYISSFNPSGGFRMAVSWDVGFFKFMPNAFHVSQDGRLMITGNFNRTVDFDPGESVFELTASEFGSAFLLALDSDGIFDSVRTWGTGSRVQAHALASDADGNIYVCGEFRKPSVESVPEELSFLNSGRWAFLSKFNSSGDMLWTRSWGGVDPGARPNGIFIIGQSDIYVTGYLHTALDVDPGPGSFEVGTDDSLTNIFSRFDSSGNFRGAVTFGDINMRPVVTPIAHSATVYLLGNFNTNVDIDPYDGEYIVQISPADVKAGEVTGEFLCCYDTDGRLLSAGTISTRQGAQPEAFTVDGSGNIYIVGGFSGEVDFDPGPRALMEEPVDGSRDIYIQKFTLLVPE